jgi:MFS family permease
LGVPRDTQRSLRRNKNLRRLFAARAVSFLGDGIAVTALTLYVKETSDSGIAVGLVLIAANSPRMLSPFTGAIADRVDRRTVMIACDLGQALVYVLIALTLPSLPVLLGEVAFATLLAATFGPASGGTVPAIVEKNDLISANALLNSTLNLYLIGGPLVAGVLVDAFGLPAALIANGGSFALSALLLAGIPRIPPQEPVGETPETYLKSVRSGLTFVRRHAVARAVVVTLFLGVAFGAVDNVALVFLVRDSLGGSPLAFGVTMAAYGVGLATGSLAPLRLGRDRDPRSLYLAGWLIFGVATIATGLAPVLLALFIAQAVAAVGNGLDNTASDTLIQQSVPQRLLGRTFGLTHTGVYVGSTLAHAGGGLLLGIMSPRAIFIFGGAGSLAVGLLGLMMLPREVLQDREAGPEASPGPK